MAKIRLTKNTLFYGKKPLSSATITQKKNGTFKITTFSPTNKRTEIKNIKTLNYSGGTLKPASSQNHKGLYYFHKKNKKGNYINYYKQIGKAF